MPLNSQNQAHSNPDKPDYWHPYYREVEPTLEYLKDLYEGRRRWIDDEGKITDSEKAYFYLPQSEAASDEQYLDQLRESVLIRFFRNAITKDIAPMLTDFALDDKAKWFEEYQDNVDLMGTTLHVFLERAIAAAERDGSSFILVDMPKADKDAKTLADVKDSKARPYLILYERENLVNWRWVNTEAGPQLQMVVMKETIYKNDGEFGHKKYERYRVLYADGKYKVFEAEMPEASANTNPQSDDVSENLEKVDEGTYDGQGIPLIGLSFGGKDPFKASPPLIDLADLNLDHYRVRSKYRTIINFMAPTLAVREPQDFAMNEVSTNKTFTTGVHAAFVNLEDVRFVEPGGGGIKPSQDCLLWLEQQMEKMTVTFFTGGFVAKTATEVQMDAAQAESTLRSQAQAVESAVQEIFKHFQAYLGKNSDDAGGIVINKALLKAPSTWTPKEILEWMMSGIMSRELGYRIMNELGLLPEGITYEEVEEELKKAQAKEEEAQAMAAEMEQRKMEAQQQELATKVQMQQQKLEAEGQRSQMDNAHRWSYNANR